MKATSIRKNRPTGYDPSAPKTLARLALESAQDSKAAAAELARRGGIVDPDKLRGAAFGHACAAVEALERVCALMERATTTDDD